MYYSVIDFICILSGAYLAYTAVSMKNKGEIIANVVLNKSTDEKSIKDKEGFINYLYIRLLIIGVVIVLSGVVDLVNGFKGGDPIVGVVTFLVFVAALIAYGLVAKRAIKRFT